MNFEANEQYAKALKNGLKYLKTAQTQGGRPYPAVLDEVEKNYEIVGRVELWVMNIPTELIVGTRSEILQLLMMMSQRPIWKMASGTRSWPTSSWAISTFRRATSGSASCGALTLPPYRPT